MAQVICPDCGTGNPPGGEFCVSCGAFLAWDGQVQESPPVPVPNPPQPPVPAQQQGTPPGQYPGQPAPGSPSGPAPAPAPAPEPVYRYQSTAPPVAPPPVAPPVAPPAGPFHGGFQQQAPSMPPGDPGGFSYTIRGPAGRTTPGNALGPPGPGYADDAAVATEAPPGSCPQCGRVNTPDRRFCGKCGFQLFTPDPGAPPPKEAPKPRRPWWQRWIPESWLPEQEMVSSEAKRAFRRQLPVGVRLRRGLGVAGVLALIIGGLFVMGTNPVRWVKDRIADAKDSLVVVADVAATADPPDSALPDGPASNLVNDNLGAWSTLWVPPASPPGCLAPGTPLPEGSPPSAILTLPGLTEVRTVDIAGGLGENDPMRPLQYRPSKIQLAFSDGSCQVIEVDDKAGLQRREVRPVVTGQIRVTVVDVFAPAEAGQPRVSVAEMDVYARP